MKNLTKLFLCAVSLAAMTSAAPVFAQDAPAWGLTGYVQMQSDYKFRGISQNERDPSFQGTLNLTGPEGFYVGSWASQVDWNMGGLTNNPSVEVDIYGGKHTDVWGIDWNIEPYYYAYPGANTFGGPTADYFELINQLTKSFNGVTLQATYAWSPEFSLGGGPGHYLAGMASFTILDWLSVSTNVGHQWVRAANASVGSRDYTLARQWEMNTRRSRDVHNVQALACQHLAGIAVPGRNSIADCELFCQEGLPVAYRY